MNLEEKSALYKDIQAKLASAFPAGTVEIDKNKSKGSIPIQAYIKRLEDAAGPYWSWRTIGEPVFYEREQQVFVKGILKILDTEREGSGFANYQQYDDTEKIKNLKYAVLSAESDAIRNACNKYQMGWIDLAPYREWSKNPGVGMENTKNKAGVSNDKKCIRCGASLNEHDLNQLKIYGVRQLYCDQHIPEHFKKK